jgi:hypothetical protein
MKHDFLKPSPRGGGDQNSYKNNTDYNLSNRDHSAKEAEGMAALARPGGLSRPSTTGNGCYTQDTDFVATNDDQGGKRDSEPGRG